MRAENRSASPYAEVIKDKTRVRRSYIPEDSFFTFYDSILKHGRFDTYAHISKNPKPEETSTKSKSHDYLELWKEETSSQADIPRADRQKCLKSEDLTGNDVTLSSMRELENEFPPTISGHILQDMNSSTLVRPTAFKPVMPASTQMGIASYTPDVDEGYSSKDNMSRQWNRRLSSRSSSDPRESDYPTFSTQHDDQTMFKQTYQTLYPTPSSTPRPTPSISSSTYSPSFSGNHNLQALLREKDTELSNLRERMETNEQAILRAYRHSRDEWKNQMSEIAQEYHRRLLAQQESFHRVETQLQKTVEDLSNENQALKRKISQQQADREEVSFLSREIARIRDQYDQTTQKLTQINCECDILRKENAELTKKLDTRNSIPSTLTQTELQTQLELSRGEIRRLKSQLESYDRDLSSLRDEHKQDRARWEEEKELVLRYQKQLQTSYVQTYRQNADLEQQLCRINSRQSRETLTLDSHIYSSRVIIASESPLPESFC